MTLRALIRRHAAQLLKTSIWIEVRDRVHSKTTGKVTLGEATLHEVRASDFGEHRSATRGDSTAPQVTAFCYVPVPKAGLDFTPARGQVVVTELDASAVTGRRSSVSEDARWTITRVRVVRQAGVILGYRLDLGRGGA